MGLLDCISRKYESAEFLCRFGRWLARSRSLVMLLKTRLIRKKNLS
jgi:hypothetical protein